MREGKDEGMMGGMEEEREDLAVVVNRNARKARDAADSLKGGWDNLRFKTIRDYYVPGRQVQDTLRRELISGTRNFAVAGGDGTVNAAVSVLAHSGARMGIIPLGTTNNFARGLGLPLNPQNSWDIINRGRSREINIGVVNGYYFANLVTIGLSVQAVEDASVNAKKSLGRVAYAISGFKQIARHRPFYSYISGSGKKRRVLTHELLVANGSHHAALPLTPGISVTDEELLVLAVGMEHDRFKHTLAAFKLAARAYNRGGGTLALKSDRFRIETWPRQDVAVDGEAVTRTPAMFSVSRRALRVFVG